MNILIVEDNNTISKNLSRYLSLKNIDSQIADSAEIAEQMLIEEKFDIMLLDIWLPGISGKEFLEKLKSEWNNIPIIFLTSRDTDDDMIAWLELWADDYISKPFDYEIVIARINSVLRRYNKETNTEKVWKYIINFDKEDIMDSQSWYKIFLSHLEFKFLSFFSKK